MTTLACAIAGCEWPGTGPDGTYADIKYHYDTTHFNHPRRNMTEQPLTQVPNPNVTGGTGWDGIQDHPGQNSPTVRDALERELDGYVKTALEWQGVKGGPFDTMPIAILEDEVKKAKATSIGRGIAIALCYMRGPQHHTPDSIINEAVARYHEAQAPQNMANELGAQQIIDEAQQVPVGGSVNVGGIDFTRISEDPFPTQQPAPTPPAAPAAPASNPVPTAPFAPPTVPTPAPAPAIPTPPAMPQPVQQYVDAGQPLQAPPIQQPVMPQQPVMQPPAQPITVESPQVPAPSQPEPLAPVVQLPVQQPPVVGAPPMQAAPEYAQASLQAAMASGGQVVETVDTDPLVTPVPTGPSAADAAASFAATLAQGGQQVEAVPAQPVQPAPLAPPVAQPAAPAQPVQQPPAQAAPAGDPDAAARVARIKEALATGIEAASLAEMMGVSVDEINQAAAQ